MRELERHSPHSPAPANTAPIRVAIVGNGRLGNALAAALRRSGTSVTGPLRREEAPPAGVHAVLLCVPDGEIAAAAATVTAGAPTTAFIGHCSGATALQVLGDSDRAFSLHPLMTVTHRGATFAGAGAAIAGASPASLDLARELAERLEMRPIEIAEGDRAAYHAAASIASNFLITLEAAAERLAATVGVQREDLLALVRATVENWAALGPQRALTGPVARGDDGTVAAQRAALAERAPELVALFDALVQATRELAQSAAVPA